MWRLHGPTVRSFQDWSQTLSTFTFVAFWAVLLVAVIWLGILSCALHELKLEVGNLKAKLGSRYCLPACVVAETKSREMSEMFHRIADYLEDEDL